MESEERPENKELMEQSEKKVEEETKNDLEKVITLTKILDDEAEFLMSRIQAQKQIHHIKSNS